MSLRCCLLVVLLFACSMAAPAEEGYWPVEFVGDTANHEEETSDEPSIGILNEMSYYHTFQSHSTVDVSRTIGSTMLDQSAAYYYTQNNLQSSTQFADFSGSILYRHHTNTDLSYGLGWSPVTSYSKDTIGALKSNADIGPIVSHTIAAIPITVQAGMHAYAWNDSIRPGTILTTDYNYHSTAGLFGRFNIGKEPSTSPAKALRFAMSGWGRIAGGNNLGLLRGSALYKSELRLFDGADSVFLYVGDSLTNGKELYIGESVGSSFVSNTSWRTNHSFSGLVGIRFQKRLGLEPRLFYTYRRRSIAFPSISESPNDIRNAMHTAGITLQSSIDRPFLYSGSLEGNWEFEDRQFKRNFVDNSFVPIGEREAYIINQSDHSTDLFRTSHFLKLQLPAHFLVTYRGTASKDSKKYPFIFRDGITSIKRNENENDRVQIDHTVSVEFLRDSLNLLKLFGTYETMFHYFYHENRCGESRETHVYRTGIDGGFSRGRFTLREYFSMDAEISDYYFKKIGDRPNEAPPYSRSISSTLTGSYQLSDNIKLNGKWVNLYNDNGYWYGEAYRPDSSTIDHEFYAIERKGIQYWLDFWIDYTGSLGMGTIGSRFRDIFERRYDFAAKTYTISVLDIGYGIEPYLKLITGGERYTVKVRVRRIFNTGDKDRWSKRKNWDMATSFQMVF